MSLHQTNLTTLQLRAIDAAHHMHPFTDTKGLNAEGARVIVKALGVHLWDSEGNKIIDGMSGLWNVNIGYGREEIIEAVAQQMRELPFYNTFFKTTHLPAIELSRLLAEVTPPQFQRVFFTGSGSESNDTIIRMVRHYWAAQDRPGKSTIIARKNGYHGSTMGGASLGGMKPMHAQGGLPIPGIVHIAQPYWYGEGGDQSPEEFGLWAARELERKIDELGADTIAAFIAEPIQGAGGVVIPPSTYWQEIQRICRERDILLVSDEVICGFGRLGEWFGCEYFGYEPDIMSMAKGISSGYLPIGGVMVNEKVAQVIANAGDFNHGYTYSGHPAAAAAAIANIKILRDEKIVERVKTDIGPYMQKQWLALGDHPIVGEARMVGLVGALELTPNKQARASWPVETGTVGLITRDYSFQNGLVMRATRDTMIIAPPLVISHEEVDELISKAKKTLNQAWAEVKRRGYV
ncbi:aspartate aminotransferase family protein [Labrys miyagiensis]|uniref:Aspartate aminotransferase family protein n=1 Tax=Labrys miyagiensis TaxID=346912 RepID=A0ABQ6CFC5_9HYPH|nr:aspartate aminotransferase family protein [Labrys miyagiensis]GLS19068.1 aspartate aminotransferase family protein [Labrys miyagiensis]